MDVIVGGELFTDYLTHPRKLVTLNLKTNHQAPDATSFFPQDVTASSWPERLLSESQDAVALQQIKERGALPAIDRGEESVRHLTRQYLGFTAGRWLWSARA